MNGVVADQAGAASEPLAGERPVADDAGRALRALAHLHGVQRSYRGADGRPCPAREDAVLAVLAALGAPVGQRADAPDALRLAHGQRWGRVVEPVLVDRPGRACRPDVRLASSLDPKRVWVTVDEEDGTSRRFRLTDSHHQLVGERTVDGVARSLHRFSLGSSSPGYHRLTLEGPGLETRALVVSAPARCPQPPRCWGTFLPLHALRTSGDWGAGSYTDLARLVEWGGGQGASFHGVLPLFATVPSGPGTPSPYLPSSRLAFEPGYVDVEALPEVHNTDGSARRAREILASPALASELSRLRASRHADLVALTNLKMPLLELLAASLAESGGTRWEQFTRFHTQHPHLQAFARFHGGPGPRSTDRGTGSDADRPHLYAQWVAHEQLAPVRDRLYLDLPVGVHPDGFDVATEADLFVHGASGGAPPDAFFGGGQDWGFPPLHPEAMRSQGYRYFVAGLRHAMAHAAMLRVDHVMGLHRLYWVPQGFSAEAGLYVRYRADELHAILVLEAARHGTVVVGEDLGTVPGTVRRDMARDGILSSFVLQFRSTTEDPVPVPPPGSLASVGTHDLPTFASIWQERSAARDSWRRAVTSALPAPPSAPAGVLRLWLTQLAASPAAAVMVDLEDLWLELEPQNRPGSGPDEANFSRRAARSFEEFSTDSDVETTLQAMAGVRPASDPPADRGRDSVHGPPREDEP